MWRYDIFHYCNECIQAQKFLVGVLVHLLIRYSNRWPTVELVQMTLLLLQFYSNLYQKGDLISRWAPITFLFYCIFSIFNRKSILWLNQTELQHDREQSNAEVLVKVQLKLYCENQGSHRSGKSGKILKTFSSQGKQGVFSQNQGKNFEIREVFFKTIFEPFNLRKNRFFFRL